MPKFIDSTGAQQEVTLQPTIFREAHDKKLTVRQLINTKYPTTVDANADTFTQMCASEGLFFKANETLGFGSTPLSEILNPSMDAANVTNENPVQSRILFPPALMSYIEDKMSVDRTSPVAAFDNLVAISTTVASARTEQPVISYDRKRGPEDTRSQQISQLAEPPAMLTITASEITRQIPTMSLGLAVSDQALQYATIDLVGLALTRQKEVEMFALAGEAMLAMLNGDSDNGQGALPTVTAQSFDAAISTAGELTQEAWIKWLYSDILKRRIDWVIVDSISTALAIENRTGKPVITGDDPNSPRIDTLFSIAYPTLAANVQMFIAPTEWSLPANTVIGIQSNSAIAKLVNSAADYEATERWALRRGEAMRMDFGQQFYRLYDDAFSVMTLTV